MVEVIKRNSWTIFFVTGLLWFVSIVLTVFGTHQFSHSQNFTPYKDVDIVSADFDVETGEYVFVANFYKIECDPETLRVAVKYPGQGVDVVPWKDIDGREDDESLGLESRSRGEQTLRIKWKMDPDFRWYEIRTSHLCPKKGDGAVERVPALFARVTGSE